MMSYFGLREWEFDNSNIDRLSSAIKSQQKMEAIPNGIHNGPVPSQMGSDLEFDMKTINWNEYFYNYLPGIKKYFFKEKVSYSSKKHYSR